MKLRFPVVAVAVAVLLALTGANAHAQASAPTGAKFALYLNPDITVVSNSVADTGTFAFLGDGNKSAVFGGVDFGGYYDFASASKYTVGIDLRDAIRHGNSALLNSFLIGVRVATKPLAFGGIKPYVQLSVGAGGTHSPYNPVKVQKLEVDGFVGVDKPLGRHVDFRAIEVGYGSLTTISSALERGTVPIPASKLINFSTGFVFRFP
jgi:hypothetical protein